MLKIISRSAVLLAATMLISACGGTSSSKMDKPAEPTKPVASLSELARSLKSESSCKAKGGQWQRVGMLQTFVCVLPTSDAGKSCTDGSQCQMSCLAKDPSLTPGSKATGQCSKSTNIFGCKTRVKDGKIEGTLCID